MPDVKIGLIFGSSYIDLYDSQITYICPFVIVAMSCREVLRVWLASVKQYDWVLYHAAIKLTTFLQEQTKKYQM